MFKNYKCSSRVFVSKTTPLKWREFLSLPPLVAGYRGVERQRLELNTTILNSQRSCPVKEFLLRKGEASAGHTVFDLQ